MIHSTEGKFPTGRIVITKTALGALAPEDVLLGLNRHVRGDWGDLCANDWLENEFALRCGNRLLSRYCTQGDVAFWIITEHDRSVTTILLPEDY